MQVAAVGCISLDHFISFTLQSPLTPWVLRLVSGVGSGVSFAFAFISWLRRQLPRGISQPHLALLFVADVFWSGGVHFRPLLTGVVFIFLVTQAYGTDVDEGEGADGDFSGMAAAVAAVMKAAANALAAGAAPPPPQEVSIMV